LSIQRLRAWSYRAQCLGRAGSGPAEVLAAVAAVYSSHPTAPWSLAARAFLTPDGFAALERDRLAVRIPAMRRSIHLVPAAEAAGLFAATRQSPATHRRAVRDTGLTEAAYEALTARILALAAEPVTLNALKQNESGPLAAVVRELAYEGLLLRLAPGLRTDGSLSYVSTVAWLGDPLDADPDASLARLAEAYLRGYGPARAADFAWWAGVPLRRATTALATVSTVDVGDGLLLPADQASAWEATPPLDPAAVDVLPKWDAYTMGYAPDGRGRLVDDAHLGVVYGDGPVASGDGMPLVLQGGRAVAVWSHRFDGDRMLVRWRPLVRGTALSARLFEPAAELLGAQDVDVQQE
jgi:hypothetical protein